MDSPALSLFRNVLFWTKVNVLMEGIKCKWWHCVYMFHPPLCHPSNCSSLLLGCPGDTRLWIPSFSTPGDLPDPGDQTLIYLYPMPWQVDFFFFFTTGPPRVLSIVALQISEGSRVAARPRLQFQRGFAFQMWVWGRVWLPAPMLS